MGSEIFAIVHIQFMYVQAMRGDFDKFFCFVFEKSIFALILYDSLKVNEIDDMLGLKNSTVGKRVEKQSSTISCPTY